LAPGQPGKDFIQGWHCDLKTLHLEDVQHKADDGGLPSTIVAEQSKHFTTIDFEGDLINCNYWPKSFAYELDTDNQQNILVELCLFFT
jgi:hypothetical protein